MDEFIYFIFQLQKVFVVGSDWGANIGWHLSLFRPDRVKGFVALGVPYFPRSPTAKTVETIRKIYGDGSHVCQFQVPFPSHACLYGLIKD